MLVLTHGTTRLPQIPSESLCFQWIPSDHFPTLLLSKNLKISKISQKNSVWGFIAQLVEHRTGIAEVTCSSPVEALIFFRLPLFSCLNWKNYCDDHSSLCMNYFIYTSRHITPHGRYELNKLTSLPMRGFIAQLVEQLPEYNNVPVG